MKRIWLVSLAAVAPILWGGMYPISKFLMKTTNSFALGEARLILAELFYILMNFFIRTGTKITWKDRGKLILLGVVGYGGTSGFQLYGTYLTSAHLAALVLALTPLLLLLSARLLLKKWVSKAVFIMAAASTVGLVVSVQPWSLVHSVNPWGLAVLFIACVAWIVYSTYVQSFMAKYNPWAVMKFSTIGGIFAVLPAAWNKIDTLQSSLSTPTGICLVLYVGIVSTGLAYICWNLSIQLVGPELPALFYFFQPLVASILGVVMLHETLTLSFLIGGIEMVGCVLLGIILHNRDIRIRDIHTKSDSIQSVK